MTIAWLYHIGFVEELSSGGVTHSNLSGRGRPRYTHRRRPAVPRGEEARARARRGRRRRGDGELAKVGLDGARKLRRVGGPAEGRELSGHPQPPVQPPQRPRNVGPHLTKEYRWYKPVMSVEVKNYEVNTDTGTGTGRYRRWLMVTGTYKQKQNLISV